MSMLNTLKNRRVRRKRGIRKKIYGTADRPRLSVKKSLRYISAQLINDDKGETVVSASTMEAEYKDKGKTVEAAALVGKLLAERAVKKDVKSVVFDRNGYPYHGKVKALAEAAREAGLQF